MMELTLSRVTAAMCALLLLAALVPHLEMSTEQKRDDVTRSLATSFDNLMVKVAQSGATLMLNGGEVLPGPHWDMTVERGSIRMTDGERTEVIESHANYKGEPFTISHDTWFLLVGSSNEGIRTVHLQKVDTMSSTPSANLDTSSRSL